jgi:hypothetical protein
MGVGVWRTTRYPPTKLDFSKHPRTDVDCGITDNSQTWKLSTRETPRDYFPVRLPNGALHSEVDIGTPDAVMAVSAFLNGAFCGNSGHCNSCFTVARALADSAPFPRFNTALCNPRATASSLRKDCNSVS